MATTDTLDTVRASLPSTADDLAAMLGVDVSAVPGIIRQLQQSGYPVALVDDTYTGRDDLSDYQLAVGEHRHLAYLATRAATLAAQFPSAERQQIADDLAAELEAADQGMRVKRQIHRLQTRRDAIDEQLAELTAAG